MGKLELLISTIVKDNLLTRFKMINHSDAMDFLMENEELFYDIDFETSQILQGLGIEDTTNIVYEQIRDTIIEALDLTFRECELPQPKSVYNLLQKG